MGLRELKLMKEDENYLDFVNQGESVAVFKLRENIDKTYSVSIEMYNCSQEQVDFIQKVTDIRQAGGFPV